MPAPLPLGRWCWHIGRSSLTAGSALLASRSRMSTSTVMAAAALAPSFAPSAVSASPRTLVPTYPARAWSVTSRRFASAVSSGAPPNAPGAPSASASEAAAERFREAERRWNDGVQSAALTPSADAHYNLGNCYYLLERHADAVQAWRAAVAVDPQHADAHVNMANVLALFLGDRSGAIEHYRLAAELRPGDGEIKYNYAVVLDSLGELDSAVELYEAAVALGVEQAQKNLRNARVRLLARQTPSSDVTKS
ncbi:hypothetical protein HK405_011256 [Cladochytrium tenue]|nr:hypothetical protein HK405_011256 [Cladochytrium tenue]